MLEGLAANPASILFILLFFGIMAVAAVYDLITYTIPNFVPIFLLGIFVVFAVWHGLPWQVWAGHAGAGFAMLIVGWLLFAIGLFGGGDSKLFAATCLWMGWDGIINYLIMLSLCGGALAIVLILFRRLPLPAALLRHGWIAALHDMSKGVPYGIALTTGAILAWPELLMLPMK